MRLIWLLSIFGSNHAQSYFDLKWKKISGDLLKYTDDKTEKISSLEKKIFWTSAQFSILNDESKKRVIFMSEFGTGKTVLLRTKAKQLLSQGKEVLIISFEDSESKTESLLATLLKAEFGNIVHSLGGSGNTNKCSCLNSTLCICILENAIEPSPL